MNNNTGCKPSIQDLKYWKDGGYIFISLETDDAITISKKDVKTEYHCAYLPIL